MMAMSPSLPTGTQKRPRKQRKPPGAKLARLPEDAKILKRPLLRPAIPSPYAGAQSQKVIYVGTKTPFLSAVKRVEKLLKLSDKRQVQSATRIVQNENKRKRRRNDDEIGQIANEVERQKRRKTLKAADDDSRPEEVVVKGTGKAIVKVMEIGCWFQERSEEYAVRLQTGTTMSIDDVEYSKTTSEGVEGQQQDDTASGPDHMDVDAPSNDIQDGTSKEQDNVTAEIVEESRIRNVSVLEVYVGLR